MPVSIEIRLRLKSLLKSEFDMKDLGSASRILGMNISRDRADRSLFISQKSFLQKIVSKFSMHLCKLVCTPLASHFQLSEKSCPETDREKNDMANVSYRMAIGSVMYSMISTRPDIAYSISLLSRFMSNPGRDHWAALKWLLRYINGTIDRGLLYHN